MVGRHGRLQFPIAASPVHSLAPSLRQHRTSPRRASGLGIIMYGALLAYTEGKGESRPTKTKQGRSPPGTRNCDCHLGTSIHELTTTTTLSWLGLLSRAPATSDNQAVNTVTSRLGLIQANLSNSAFYTMQLNLVALGGKVRRRSCEDASAWCLSSSGSSFLTTLRRIRVLMVL